MGEVYEARDTRLDRRVAIKVLREHLASDPVRRARFDREARAISKLNYPKICTLYDVGHENGVDYLVAEYIDGQTLADRLKRGALPVDQALSIAIDIAAALDAAHRAGIIHRDLKPANVMLAKAGAKLLDFGIAREIPNEPVTATITRGTLTADGTLLGTVPYMSPEQLEGRDADARSDIFAFGAVLYEMLSGLRAFSGDRDASIIAGVLEREPTSLKTVQPVTPPFLERLVTKCLAKAPDDRWQTSRDLLDELKWINSTLSESRPPAIITKWDRLPWALVAALIAALIVSVVMWAPWRGGRLPDRPLVRLDVDLGADAALPAAGASGSSVAISPDGTRLAYVSGPSSTLFTRRLDQPDATEFQGIQGVANPFFSPDGQWIGFVAANKLSKISIEGGTPVVLADVPYPTFRGASWGEDGSIVVASHGGLLRISGAGGPPEIVAEIADKEGFPLSPQVLPGGEAVLFSSESLSDVNTFAIEVVTLADHRRKVVSRGGQSPRYVPAASGEGHLIYINKSTLLAIPFDLTTLETRGAPVPIVNDVSYSVTSAAGQFDLSRAGTLIYRRSSPADLQRRTLRWLGSDGKNEAALGGSPGFYDYVTLSPDGTRIALVIREGGRQDVWVYDRQRDAMTRLSFDGADYLYPRWTPDGRYVVFSSRGRGIMQTRADGSGQPQILLAGATALFPWSISPDGKWLAYDDLGVSNYQIGLVSLEDQGGRLKAGTPEQLKSKFYDLNPSFSPDGRWLAYESNESGANEIYVRAFPISPSGQGGRWQISNGGANFAHWSRSAPELVYRQGGRLMAARYSVQGDTFVPEKPRVWIPNVGAGQWDLAPDGRRAAVIVPVESEDTRKQEHEVVFLQNFVDELRRRAPPSAQP
jgi:serine/threonine-protein kinase